MTDRQKQTSPPSRIVDYTDDGRAYERPGVVVESRIKKDCPDFTQHRRALDEYRDDLTAGGAGKTANLLDYLVGHMTLRNTIILSQKQVAAALHITPKTLRKRLARLLADDVIRPVSAGAGVKGVYMIDPHLACKIGTDKQWQLVDAWNYLSAVLSDSAMAAALEEIARMDKLIKRILEQRDALAERVEANGAQRDAEAQLAAETRAEHMEQYRVPELDIEIEPPQTGSTAEARQSGAPDKAISTGDDTTPPPKKQAPKKVPKPDWVNALFPPDPGRAAAACSIREEDDDDEM